jgi:Peptidase A4 family
VTGPPASGFPPRPDAVANPRIAALWEATFGRDIAFAAAELKPSVGFRSHPRQRSTVNEDDSGNWSGASLNNPASGPFAGVAASWNVPTLTSLDESGQSISIWVGLDGQSADVPLLQTGVAGSFQNGGASWYAWTEWLSAGGLQPPQVVSNLPVQAGDTVAVQIWVTSPSTATVILQNVSSVSQSAVMLPVTAPPGTIVLGATAEWIVERPLLADQSFAPLPDYSPVTFTECAAWSSAAGGNKATESFRAFATGVGAAFPAGARSIAASMGLAPPISLREMLLGSAVLYAGTGQTVTMVENNVPISVAFLQSKDTIVCEYSGVQPGKLGVGDPPLHLK